jgi:hypothetical protein
MLEKLRARDHPKDPGTDGKTILKRIPEKEQTWQRTYEKRKRM